MFIIIKLVLHKIIGQGFGKLEVNFVFGRRGAFEQYIEIQQRMTDQEYIKRQGYSIK